MYPILSFMPIPEYYMPFPPCRGAENSRSRTLKMTRVRPLYEFHCAAYPDRLCILCRYAADMSCCPASGCRLLYGNKQPHSSCAHEPLFPFRKPLYNPLQKTLNSENTQQITSSVIIADTAALVKQTVRLHYNTYRRGKISFILLRLFCMRF